jgi:DNA mismatch repair ATPase MutL
MKTIIGPQFTTQAIARPSIENSNFDDFVSSQSSVIRKGPQHLVRTDPKTRTLDAYLCSDVGSSDKRFKSSSSFSQASNSGRPFLEHTVLSGQGNEHIVRDVQGTNVEKENHHPSINSNPATKPNPTKANTDMAVDEIQVLTPTLDARAQIKHTVSLAHASQPTVTGHLTKQWTEVRLTSVISLIEAYRKSEHQGLTDAFRSHTFVGCINNSLALIQHQTHLLMVDFTHLSEVLFYQLSLVGFNNFGLIPIDEPACIYLLSLVALDTIGGWQETMMPKIDIAQVTDAYIRRSPTCLWGNARCCENTILL